MIRTLRVAHRLIFVGLAIILTFAFLFGLRARRYQVPQHKPISNNSPSDFTLMDTIGLRVRARDGYIETLPARPLNSPDPLLYFGRAPQIEGATLLGPLEGSTVRRFAIPESGYLIVYSLARREIVAFEKLNVSWSPH